MLHRIALAAAVTILTGQAILAPQPAPAAVTAPAEMLQFDHLSVQVVGRGSPIILVPGLSSPRAVWDGVVPALSAKHRVYLVQVNGFGGGDPGANLAPGILDGIVADLHKLIGDHKLKDAKLVGHSMGGLVGLMLAKAHPADVSKLMIVDSLPFIGEIFAPGITVEAIKPQAAAMRAQMAGSYGTPLPDAVAQAIASNNAIKPDSQATIAGWMRNADMRVTGQAMYEDMTTDLRGDMASIATPITLVYPWSERLPKAQAGALYHRQYDPAPHVEFVDVADSGHFVMLDQPAAFEAALLAFAGN